MYVPKRAVTLSFPLEQKTAGGCSLGYRHCEDIDKLRKQDVGHSTSPLPLGL